MKKFVVMALIAVLALTVFALPVAAKTTVTFWHAMSKGHSPFLEDIVKRFNKSQSEIEVVLIYQGSYSDLSKKLLGAVAAGKPPVMAQVYEDWTTKLVDAGALEPAQKYIGSVFSDADIKDIFAGFRESNTWDNTLYTLPFNKSTNVLYVNKELVSKIPTTWTELVTASKAATKDANGDGTPEVYGFGIRPTVDQFNIFLRQAGGTFLTPDGKKAAFNNAAGQQALQFLYDMIYTHKCALLHTGYLNEPFGEGKLAMYEDTSAGLVYAGQTVGNKFKWTAAPLVRGKVAAAPTMGTNVAVFSKASAVEKKAAFEFIKFLINTENTVYWAKNSGYLPVRESALKTQEWRAFVLLDTKNMAAPKQYDYATFDPRPDGWTEIRDIIDNAVKEALLKKATVKQALDKAADAVNKVLAKNN